MIPVLSRADSRAFDHEAIVTRRVPGVVLMENAGRGVVDAMVREWPDRPLRAARVVLVCGPGNNGGDGFVIARRLLVSGASVRVFTVVAFDNVTGDARAHLEALGGLGLVVEEVEEELGPLRAALEGASFVVDAMFGTGLTRPIEGLHANVLEAMGRAKCPVVAVDVPSGLDADTGMTLGAVLQATLTVTFVAPKLGLLTPRGAKLAGKLVIADIGVPPPGADDEPLCSARLVERSDIVKLVSPRSSDVHKNGAGHVVIFAGSSGHVGAALMCAHGAFRAGAGLVTIATWPEVHQALDARVLEVMSLRLDRDAVAKSVDRALAGAEVVVIGPGFGKDDAAREAVEHVLASWVGPSVVDADALALFAGRPSAFAASKGAAVLTPHPGEMGGLLGKSAREVEADRFASLAECLELSRSVTLLKGAHTLVGAPEESPVINRSGTSALATAGSGDVLSGTIGALLCTLDPFEAAFAGAYLHGAAAEAWSAGHGDRGLLAHEIADEYPRLLLGLLADR